LNPYVVEGLLLRFRIPYEDEKTYEPDPAWHLLDGPRQPGYMILATFGPAAGGQKGRSLAHALRRRWLSYRWPRGGEPFVRPFADHAAMVSIVMDVASTKRATERTILMANIDVGERFPDVVLPDERGEPFDLRSELAKGPLMLVFYRGDW
jgi:hypothetical protein